MKRFLIVTLICSTLFTVVGCANFLHSLDGDSYSYTNYGVSMVPTIAADERVSGKLTNGSMPNPGDIIAFRYDVGENSGGVETLIKRVIAVEGQTIDINFDTGEVFVDGYLLDEPYISEPTTSGFDFVGPVSIPDGHVFVMGDNRNKSIDSRSSGTGFISAEDIIAIIIL